MKIPSLSRYFLIVFMSIPIILFLYAFSVFYIMALFHTEYAPGYSYWKFKMLQPGLSEEEVIAQVGQPIQILPRMNCDSTFYMEECVAEPGRVDWWYSRQDSSDTHYFVRRLEMRNHRVVNILSELYVD